ncbi:hypothetical protein [Streptomonospora litoralis]|uniref:hypothetical protein n=1 Tax=Streptomonospora litoralis TaxID=2498135 RepID=UPI0013F14A20|nr:hypothetical protein [Streptomonospora litoralis]
MTGSAEAARFAAGGVLPGPAPADPRPPVIDVGSTAAAHATHAHRAGQDARRRHVRHLSGTHEVDLDHVADLARQAIHHWRQFVNELEAERHLGDLLAAGDPTEVAAEDREEPPS